MPLILCPCKSLSFSNCTIHTLKNNPPKNPMKIFCSFSNKFSTLISAHVAFCSMNGKFDGFSSNQLTQEALGDGIQEQVKLELMNKPSPVDKEKGSTQEEALAPFLKFPKDNGSLQDGKEDGNGVLPEASEERENEETEKVNTVEYYEPKPGDVVIGVVVSGTESKLSVNVGAELLGTMLTKEVLPLYSKELENLLCDLEKDEEVKGRMRILKNDESIRGLPVQGSSVVEVGTILFAEVLGRTLTGRPLLSTRRLFRRVAWHRLRQIKQLNEPIKVRITEWNTKGLLTRIEGLRAFLPQVELVKRVNSFTELKESVGRCMYVQITQVDEANGNLILSEREAWEKLYLQEGTLLEGTVKKILPYGAQIRIGETNRCGLLHVSNITRAHITSVSDILSVDEKLKVLVVKSVSPDKISLSIADLESEPGLFLSNKERVFLEADMMARKYKEKIHPNLMIIQESETIPTGALHFENEALYANWKWFKFEK